MDQCGNALACVEGHFVESDSQWPVNLDSPFDFMETALRIRIPHAKTPVWMLSLLSRGILTRSLKLSSITASIQERGSAILAIGPSFPSSLFAFQSFEDRAKMPRYQKVKGSVNRLAGIDGGLHVIPTVSNTS